MSYRRVTITSLCGLIWACAPEGASGPSPEPEIGAAAASVLPSGRLFPGRAEDLPPGGVWKVTDDHYDMNVIRFDASAGHWTMVHPGATGQTPDDFLVYGMPIYASSHGEVMRCWRNAPEGAIGVGHPGRDGCVDLDEDGDPCEFFASCSCTIPQHGNHVEVLGVDGMAMLYAHLMPGSVPEAVCPHDDAFVADASGGDPTGGLAENLVPEGSRAAVQKGQFLGYVGYSGATSLPHLHHSMTQSMLKVDIAYVGGQWQPYPGDQVNALAGAWTPLDGVTPLISSASDPQVIVAPDDGPGTAWAYVWASNAAADHVPPSTYSRSSAGDVFGLGVSNSVDHIGPGQYLVAFPEIGSAWHGNPQVTAYGSDAVRCKARGIFPLPTGVLVRVDCHAPGGAPANSRFVASYVRRGSPTGDGEGAYLTTSSTGSEIPPIESQWSSSGAPGSVERLAAGWYRVVMPGQAPRPRGGTVMVTAFGDSSDHCKVASWSEDGDAVVAVVRCFATNGKAHDSRFSLFYSPTWVAGGLSGGHVWANQPTTSQYSPASFYEYVYKAIAGEVATPITATRAGAGLYTIRYPSLSVVGSTALVTAYGSTADYCKLAGWQASNANTLVNVRCFSANGSPVDTRFVSGYANTDLSL